MASNYTHKNWSKEEEEEFHKQYIAGIKMKAIERNLSRGADSVRAKLRNERKKNPRKWPKRTQIEYDVGDKFDLYLKASEKEFVESRALALEMSKSGYIRSLIAQDRMAYDKACPKAP